MCQCCYVFLGYEKRALIAQSDWFGAIIIEIYIDSFKTNIVQVDHTRYLSIVIDKHLRDGTIMYYR